MRTALVLCAFAVGLVSCSAAPVTNPAADATLATSRAEVVPDGTTSANAEIVVGHDVAPAAAGAPVPSKKASREGKITDPPASGRYVYRQDGFQTFGALRFDFDPEGTFDVYTPSGTESTGRQRTVRRYAESRERETVTLYRRDAILLEEATERLGSGAARQSFRCRTPEPVPILPVPWRVGATWQGGGNCDGLELTYEATLRDVERRSIGGTTIRTLVVEASYRISGRDIEQQTEATIWFAPDHRLVARQIERSVGSYQGTPFERELTEELSSLTPSAF